jgi:crossover junction endodeoxyribonuclease RuvC
MTSGRRVVGVDGSLTSSGYAFFLDSQLVTGRIRPKALRGAERLKYLASAFEDIFFRADADFLALEGYSMGSKGSRVFHIGELGGVLKLVAIRREMRILTIPPSSVKVFATGNGRAEKDDVIRAIEANWGVRVDQHDQADAFVLLQMGIAFGNRRVYRQYPEQRRRALEGCELEY